MLRLSASWIVSAAMLATPALAQVYKWVDESGMVNYGDKPPPRSKGAHPLDEGAGSLSVVPGIPKDELDRLRRQDDQQRLQRLEREVDELRAQASPASECHARARLHRELRARLRLRHLRLPRLRPLAGASIARRTGLPASGRSTRSVSRGRMLAPVAALGANRDRSRPRHGRRRRPHRGDAARSSSRKRKSASTSASRG